jgi:subtilisin family serine protease
MTILSRIALLSLGVSALPFAAAAEDTGTPWVYGVAERHEAEADDGNVWYSGLDEDELLTPSAQQRQPKPPKPPKVPKAPAPAPTPPAPPPVTSPPGNTTGAGILVAIVDTGIDLDHPEFAGRIASGGTCFGGSSACPGLAAQGDDNQGHGTHVAGIVASAANGVGNTGVAPGALLLPVKVLDASGSGSYSAVASGISYAASKGARVINMSLGGSSPSTTLLAPLQQAAPTAVIVAAAGNSGNAFAPGYPAAYATQAGVVGSMIIVGSVGANNVISSFSQTPGSGGCVASGGKTTCFKDVFLVAPGQAIYSTYMGGGYATMSGTSMATPYVSGVAARVLGAAPDLTSKQVVSILFESATDLGAPGTDAIYGRGLVNLTKALQPLGTTSVATSGGTTSSYQGTSDTRTAGVSGVLASGLRGSQVAKNLVFFDAYGRDYQTDLSQSTSSNAMSIAGFVTPSSGYWRSVEVAGQGFSVAGFVSDEMPNAVATAGFAEQAHTELNDVVVRAKLSNDATMIVGYNASPVGHLNQLDLAASEAYDGLFMSASAMNSPFLALTSDGQFLGAGVKLADNVTLTFGHAATEETSLDVYEDGVLSIEESLAQLTQDPSHMRSAENTVAAMNWRFAPWGVAGFNVAHTNEENSLLGTQEQGALALTADAATTSVGFGARMNLGDDWVASVSYTRGTTDASPVAGGLFQSFSSIESEAYGVALSKLGVFGESDSLGLAVSRPLHITGGSAVIHASTGVTEEREILYSTEVINLASSTPETDYEVGYTARLDDNLTLQASAMYQQNVGGEAGEDAVAGFVTLKGTW